MPTRRRPDEAVGLGSPNIPYDQSGGVDMPGMQVPEPGGTMKKMSFEFTDPAAAAAQPQIPQGAGIPPSGMQQGGVPPTGMQTPQAPPQAPVDPSMGQPQQDISEMFSDQALQQLVGEPNDPDMLMGQDMHQSLMTPNVDPMMQQQMMEAARRRLGGL